MPVLSKIDETPNRVPGENSMSGMHKEPNYMMVFVALFVLTVFEIGAVYLPIGRVGVGIVLILLALSKASLVAMYFMHLKFEKRTLGIIALTPLILCTLLIIALLPDLTGTPRDSARLRAEQAQQAEAPAAVEAQ